MEIQIYIYQYKSENFLPTVTDGNTLYDKFQFNAYSLKKIKAMKQLVNF